MTGRKLVPITMPYILSNCNAIVFFLSKGFSYPSLDIGKVESIGNPAGIGKGTGFGLRERDRDGIGLGHYRLRAISEPLTLRPPCCSKLRSNEKPYYPST